MKPYIVTQADIDALDSRLNGLDEDTAGAFDVVAFYLWPDVTPPEEWPEGMTAEANRQLMGNPIMSMSYAIRQLDEIVAGLAHRMTFAYYRLLLVKAVASAADSEEATYKHVLDKLTHWVFTNVQATSEADVNAFFLHIHKLTIEGATKLVLILQQNQAEWDKTNELCDKYGIDFEAVMAKNEDAVHALEVAAVKEMPDERLGQYVTMARMSPDANQDAVTIAVDRLNALMKTAEGRDAAGVIMSSESFRPNLQVDTNEEHIRA
jgi:hypothetical protein